MDLSKDEPPEEVKIDWHDDENLAISFACNGIASLTIIHEQMDAGEIDWKKLCHGIMSLCNRLRYPETKD